MAAPSYVFTLARVAKMLGEDEELLRELAEGMEPEDGCLSVLGPDNDDSITAFTPFGVENLQQLLEDHKERG
jgi:hypothetical protein